MLYPFHWTFWVVYDSFEKLKRLKRINILRFSQKQVFLHNLMIWSCERDSITRSRCTLRLSFDIIVQNYQMTVIVRHFYATLPSAMLSNIFSISKDNLKCIPQLNVKNDVQCSPCTKRTSMPDKLL